MFQLEYEMTYREAIEGPLPAKEIEYRIYQMS